MEPSRQLGGVFRPRFWVQGHRSLSSLNDGNRSDYAVEFRSASYRLPAGACIISGLNLQVSPGETLVLLGRSGSGKTTVLKLINRLIEPTEGEVLISGRST